jgi:hypothetical protein
MLGKMHHAQERSKSANTEPRARGCECASECNLGQSLGKVGLEVEVDEKIIFKKH